MGGRDRPGQDEQHLRADLAHCLGQSVARYIPDVGAARLSPAALTNFREAFRIPANRTARFYLHFRRRCLQETTLLKDGELLAENLEAMSGSL